MTIYGSWVSGTIANNATTSGAIDLGRDYDYIDIVIPTLTSCTLKLTVCPTLGGTYKDLGNSLTTATTTGNYTTVFRLGGFQYIKVVSSVNQGAERIFTIRGVRN